MYVNSVLTNLAHTTRQSACIRSTNISRWKGSILAGGFLNRYSSAEASAERFASDAVSSSLVVGAADPDVDGPAISSMTSQVDQRQWENLYRVVCLQLLYILFCIFIL